MPVYRRNLNIFPGPNALSPDLDTYLADMERIALQGDIFRVACPHCGQDTEAVCITPGAQSVICTSCHRAVGQEYHICFLRSGLLDLEEGVD